MGNVCGGPPAEQGRGRSNTAPLGKVATKDGIKSKKTVKFDDEVVDKNLDKDKF